MATFLPIAASWFCILLGFYVVGDPQSLYNPETDGE